MINMPERKTVIIGIFTCPKYQDREQAVRETWFQDIPEGSIAFFVVSDEGREARLEGDILYLDCPEGYEFLPVKTWHFIKYCLEHFDFEYIFKADDDSYVNLPVFGEFRKSGDYIGRFTGGSNELMARTWHYGKFTDRSLEKPYSGKYIKDWAAGGDGYFLNRKAATIFVQNAVNIVESELLDHAYCGWEDKMVGDVLSADPSIIEQNAPLGAFGAIHPANPLAMRMIHAQFKYYMSSLSVK